MQKLEDEQLEASGFVFQCIVEVVLEVYQVFGIEASSWVEVPEKYRKNKSKIIVKNDDKFCFLWCILAHLYPAEDHKKRRSNFPMHLKKFNLGLEVPKKVEEIPKFESLNIGLRINVFELNKTTLTPIHNKKTYLQPQLGFFCIKITILSLQNYIVQ